MKKLYISLLLIGIAPLGAIDVSDIKGLLEEAKSEEGSTLFFTRLLCGKRIPMEIVEIMQKNCEHANKHSEYPRRQKVVCAISEYISADRPLTFRERLAKSRETIFDNPREWAIYFDKINEKSSQLRKIMKCDYCGTCDENLA